MNYSLLNLLSQTLIGVGLFAVAAVGYVYSRRAQRFDAINLYIGYWRELNRLFLESDRARTVRAMLQDRQPSDTSDQVSLIGMYVNQALVAYYTWRYGGLPKYNLEAEYKGVWAILAKRAEMTIAFVKDEPSFPRGFVDSFLRLAPAPKEAG